MLPPDRVRLAVSHFHSLCKAKSPLIMETLLVLALLVLLLPLRREGCMSQHCLLLLRKGPEGEGPITRLVLFTPPLTACVVMVTIRTAEETFHK